MTSIEIAQYLILSIKVSIFASVLSLLVSLPLGLLLGSKNFPLKSIISSIISSLTSIPPVCAGLVVYLLVSRSGPLGWMEILYTPSAMILAQSIIVIPIMTTLIKQNIEQEIYRFQDEFQSYGITFFQTLKLLVSNKIRIFLIIFLIGFGRAVSEYGAAAIVGGSIDEVTRNMTAAIAIETAKGNISLAIYLGIVLISISFFISLIINRNQK